MTMMVCEVKDVQAILSALIHELVDRERLDDLADLHRVLKQEVDLLETVVKT